MGKCDKKGQRPDVDKKTRLSIFLSNSQSYLHRLEKKKGIIKNGIFLHEGQKERDR